MSVKPRILICDDQQKWVRIIKDLLGRSYSVEAVNTVDDSKKSLEKDRQKDLRSRYAAVIAARGETLFFVAAAGASRGV